MFRKLSGSLPDISWNCLGHIRVFFRTFHNLLDISRKIFELYPEDSTGKPKESRGKHWTNGSCVFFLDQVREKSGKCLGKLLGKFPLISGNLSRKFPGKIRKMSGKQSRKHPGNFRVMSRKCPGKCPGNLRGNLREISLKFSRCPVIFGKKSVNFPRNFQGNFREISGETSGEISRKFSRFFR